MRFEGQEEDDEKDTMKIQGMSFHFWPRMWNSSSDLTGVDVGESNIL